MMKWRSRTRSTITRLGVLTAADTGGTGIKPWEEGRHRADTPQLSAPSTEISAEAVATLEPDLIVATAFWGLDQRTYGALSAIASVLHFDTATNADPWQDNVRKIGKVMDRQAEAEKSIEPADGVVASARSNNPQLAGTSYNAVISPSADGYRCCVRRMTTWRV